MNIYWNPVLYLVSGYNTVLSQKFLTSCLKYLLHRKFPFTCTVGHVYSIRFYRLYKEHTPSIIKYHASANLESTLRFHKRNRSYQIMSRFFFNTHQQSCFWHRYQLNIINVCPQSILYQFFRKNQYSFAVKKKFNLNLVTLAKFNTRYNC